MDNFIYFTKLQQLSVKAKLHPQFWELIEPLNHQEAEAKCQAIFTEILQAYQESKAIADSPRQLSEVLKTLLSEKLEK
jgi:oligoendopeptidase F